MNYMALDHLSYYAAADQEWKEFCVIIEIGAVVVGNDHVNNMTFMLITSLRPACLYLEIPPDS